MVGVPVDLPRPRQVIGVGEPAPELRLPDIDGSLVDVLAGDGAALLVFLPAAFTPVCSAELGDLLEVAADLEPHGARVIGVSCDSMFALRVWAEEAGTRGGALTLLSDFWPHGDAARRYRAFDEARGIATRTSYLIDDGAIRWATQSPAGVARDMHGHRDAVVQYLDQAA